MANISAAPTGLAHFLSSPTPGSAAPSLRSGSASPGATFFRTYGAGPVVPRPFYLSDQDFRNAGRRK